MSKSFWIAAFVASIPMTIGYGTCLLYLFPGMASGVASFIGGVLAMPTLMLLGALAE